MYLKKVSITHNNSKQEKMNVASSKDTVFQLSVAY
jgi:hypothetical protein